MKWFMVVVIGGGLLAWSTVVFGDASWKVGVIAHAVGVVLFVALRLTNRLTRAKPIEEKPQPEPDTSNVIFLDDRRRTTVDEGPRDLRREKE